jgi:TolA-binding protein
MSRFRFSMCIITLILVGCSTVDQKGTIGDLRNRRIDITDEQLEGGLEKAMMSYQRFLAETPDSRLSAEAIRRLADLKVEKEYGLLTSGNDSNENNPSVAFQAHETALITDLAPTRIPDETPVQGESDADFADRASLTGQVEAPDRDAPEQGKGPLDLERAGPLEAIALYQKLLDEYPLYDRNDQVLYQMSRAYEELGRIEEAMLVMNRLVRDYPQSRFIDEVQFRRAEYYFTRRQYLDAEEAYLAIVSNGKGSFFYPFALYKLGWTFYKQELYEDALDNFIALLDYKVSVGYDFNQADDDLERQRIDDTFRVISLSFSSLGGADIVEAYFTQHGARNYEDLVYSNLGEYYFDKRRYNDANATYTAFVERNPFHVKAPNFQMRIIEINIAGGFPSLVLESKKVFATRYGLQSDYWDRFDPNERPEVLNDLKTNLTDLANHYHAMYQDKEFIEEKGANFEEALHWYREFLASFPKDLDSPAVNYQMADLLLENHAFDQAALEYEKTAYEYPTHEKSSTAGYAAVYAYREYLDTVSPGDKDPVKLEVIRSSVQFAETFPEHEKAAVVLGAAVDDLYDMQEYEQAVTRAHQLVESFPQADSEIRRSAWIVIGHASYELERYSDAETAYHTVLESLPTADDRFKGLIDNLAASIYRQGEDAVASNDFRAAADHFLRVSRMAPSSAIRPNADFDAATALIQLQDWTAAATVLSGFRQNFPSHELQPEVTKKIAYVYREDGRLGQAAEEYERIETETDDEDVRREALLTAADLYEESGNKALTLQVYQRYVNYFPEPVELNIETRHKISLLLETDDPEGYLKQLEQIVAIETAAGDLRTARTRYLASHAALILAERNYKQFVAVQLVKPFKANLLKKQALMKEVTQQFKQLLDYEIADVTAASTFYLAEIYAHFSKALLESERPDNLTSFELEQYELAIEEQAYPFEEKAITVHESNLELISLGIYNSWIEKSLNKLAKIMPARYDRPEAESPVMMSLESYTYEVERPTRHDQSTSIEHTASTDTGTADQLIPQEAVEKPSVAPEKAEPIDLQAASQVSTDQAPQENKDALTPQSVKQ